MSGKRGRPGCVFAVVLFVLLLAGSADAAGMLIPRDGSPPIQVRSHRVTAELSNGLARTTLRQTFVNPHSRSLEAVYVFPLPESAALVDVAMEVGGQRLEGLLVTRRRARKIYDEIVSSRRDPAILEKIARGQFRLSVFPVVSRQATVVEITWIERVPLAQGVYRYVYPLALAGSSGQARQDFKFSLKIDSAIPITSVTSSDKDMKIETKEGKTAEASFERLGGKLDRDIVVEAAVEVPQPTLSVKSFQLKEGKGSGFFVAIVTPPKAEEAALIPRDVVLVLDASGSMRGKKMEQAKKSAQHLIAGLRDVDRVNVVRFSSDVSSFADVPVPATGENRKKLLEFVASLTPGGGTCLADAIARAVDYPPAEGRVRTVVLLTDGCPTLGVTDASRIVQTARESGKKGFRIFCFGVGDDVDPVLLEAVSRASAGAAEWFRPEDEVESRLNRFLIRTASPVIADIKVTVDGTNIHDLHPRPLPDAYLGEQVVVAGRYRDGGKHQVKVSATIGTQKTELSKEFHFRVGEGGTLAVMQLYAAQKLAHLESLMRLESGLSDEAFFAAVDQGQYDSTNEIVDEMIRTSLECGVQCAYTSFLVLLPEDRWRIDPDDADALADARKRAEKAKGEVFAKKDAAKDGTGGAPAGGEGLPDPEPGDEKATPPAAPPPPPDVPDGPNTGSAPGSGDSEPPPDERHAQDPPPDGGGSSGGEGSGGGSEGEGGGGGEPGEDGKYRGAAGGVPAGERGEGDRQPPAEGGDSEPPVEEPDAGTPDRGAPESPSGTTPPPGLGAGGGLATPGGRKSLRSGPPPQAEWLRWWEYNRDEFLARVVDRNPNRAHLAADARTLEALRKVARDRAVDSATRGAALLALARAGGPVEHPHLIEAFRNGRDGVAIRAALGLGTTGAPSPAVRKALLSTARAQVRSVRVRVAALIALGLMKDDSPEVILALLDLIERESEDREVRAAAFLTIGLIGDEGFVPRLTEWLKTGRVRRRKLLEIERASIADALGRIGHSRAVPVLIDGLRQKGCEVPRSAVLALGRIAPRRSEDGQMDVVKALIRNLTHSSDGSVRNLTVIALGRIAAAEETFPVVRVAIVRFLYVYYRDANKLTERPFAALALGIVAPALPRAERDGICRVLRKPLVALKDDRIALGANAVALGLAGDKSPETLSILRQYLADNGQEYRLRKGVATALGLLEDVEALPDLEAAILLRHNTEVTNATCRAAGLIGDRRTVVPLLRSLLDPRTRTDVRAAMAAALGRLGDVEVGPELVRFVGDASGRTIRASAAEALGHLFERPGTIPLWRVTTDVNYGSLGKNTTEVLRAR